MNSKDIAIQVDGISKCYRIGLKEQMHENFANAAFDFLKSPITNYKKYRSLYRFKDVNPQEGVFEEKDDIIWALKNVSFNVGRGQVLGIIGRNGTGKSTLLKILSRITDPTRGQARIKGKVASLLEVGTGFHHELTGRDNVYLNGTVLGMKKREIDRKFDEIVDFSGVEKFIDTPVKRYSSGMQVRLAFAVAAHLQPEILVIDEVLAVGDAEFQNKCLGKMHDITQQGRTVLFVSHNMGAVIQLCPRTILLNKGQLIADGPSKDVVEEYISTIFSPVDNHNLLDVEVRGGDGRLKFVSAFMRSPGGIETRVPIAGMPIDVVLDYKATQELSRVQFMFTIFNQLGVAVTHCNVDSAGKRLNVSKGPGRVVCSMPVLPLPLGQYKVALSVRDDHGEMDWVPTACIFNVESSKFFSTSFVPPIRYSTALVAHHWAMEKTPLQFNAMQSVEAV